MKKKPDKISELDRVVLDGSNEATFKRLEKWLNKEDEKAEKTKNKSQ